MYYRLVVGVAHLSLLVGLIADKLGGQTNETTKCERGTIKHTLQNNTY